MQHYPKIFLILAFFILVHSGPSCSITSRIYDIDYNTTEVIFPIASNYSFSQSAYTYADFIVNYSLRLLEFANCSVDYTTAYKNFSSYQDKKQFAGTTCFIKEQLYFSLNLTVIGEATMSINLGNTNSTQCTGWVYLNVTKPPPIPNPNLVQQISDLNDTVKTSSKISLILLIVTISILVVISGALIFYCIKKNKRPQKSYKLLSNSQNTEKIDTNVKVDDYYIKQPEN